jgi:predicted nucleic acid-binding protein
MSARFFLDTNVFVYSFDRTAPKKIDPAARVIRRAIEARARIVSDHVVQEFFNLPIFYAIVIPNTN